jgi:hypothetical protein
MSKSIFKDNAFDYYEANLIVTPLNGKRPFIKNWQDAKKYNEEFYDLAIEKFSSNNIGLLTGAPSGIVAVDIDKEDYIKHIPKSPVVKKGKKGETRFFKYNGEKNVKKHDIGIEILSTGNQTVLPPSIHPETKEEYYWLGDDLISKVDSLPDLDKEFYRRISGYQSENVSEGRHSKLIEVAGALIENQTSIDAAIEELIRFDDRNHEPPYFTDKSEQHKGTGFLAALNLYSSLANTVNSRGRFHPPIYVSEEIDFDEIIQAKKKKVFLPKSHGHLKNLEEYILKNSPKPRKAFALASAQAIIGTLLSNKVSYGNITTNLYQILIAESGEGKDFPLKAPTELFANNNVLQYSGLENYTSHAAYLQELKDNRERLDVIDEASKMFHLLKETRGYSVGLAETITQTWACTNSLFKGQKTKTDGVNGICYSPAVSILAGTTPKAFSQSFDSSYFGQGFGARFLYLYEGKRKRVQIIRKHEPLDAVTNAFLRHWGVLKIDEEEFNVSSLGAKVTEMNDKGKFVFVDLTSIQKPVIHDLKPGINPKVLGFAEEMIRFYDELAMKESDNNIRALLNRAYQNTLKVAMISAAARLEPGNPDVRINFGDIEYGVQFTLYCIESARDLLSSYLYESEWQRIINEVLNHSKSIQSDEGTFTKSTLRKSFNKYPGKTIEKALQDLIDLGKVILTGEAKSVSTRGAVFKIL